MQPSQPSLRSVQHRCSCMVQSRVLRVTFVKAIVGLHEQETISLRAAVGTIDHCALLNAGVWYIW